MSSFLKQLFYNICFIIKYNNRFVNSWICNAQTRKAMILPYILQNATRSAHKQCLLKPKSVTLFRFSQNIKLQTIYRFKVLILHLVSVIMITVPLILF